ncbi:MAG: ABC transporter permease [Chloroflexota bacterium]|nr:ABC transporter permease [Chloroflexota bacterium]
MITIAVLTVREAARRRLVWLLVALTIGSVALTGWGVERLATLAREGGTDELSIRIGVSQILILVAFMFSFVVAMTAAFLAAPAIAGDLESGVAMAMLARPIRRADLVIGRWLGLSIVLAGYAAASGLLEIVVVAFLTGHSPPQPLVAVAFLAGQGMVILTLALLLGTRLPSVGAGAVCVVLFGLAWMAGVFAGIARLFDVEVLAAAARASRWLLPTDGLWRGVVYALEPPLVIAGAGPTVGPLADANPFYASAPPPLEFVAWSVVWVGLVLALAVWSLNHREL